MTLRDPLKNVHRQIDSQVLCIGTYGIGYLLKIVLRLETGSTCATLRSVDTVGLRELRQDASELIRRVEAGEQIDITVAGRLAARIVPVAPKRWQTWDAIADLFHGPPDTSWESDQELVDQSITNPWDDA